MELWSSLVLYGTARDGAPHHTHKGCGFLSASIMLSRTRNIGQDSTVLSILTIRPP